MVFASFRTLITRKLFNKIKSRSEERLIISSSAKWMRKRKEGRETISETKGIAERQMARRDRVSLTLGNRRKRAWSVRRGSSVIVNLSGTTGWLAEISGARLNRNPAEPAEERAHRFTVKIN